MSGALHLTPADAPDLDLGLAVAERANKTCAEFVAGRLGGDHVNAAGRHLTSTSTGEKP